MKEGPDISRIAALMGDPTRVRLCRSCLDWSERRNHLSGSLGRAMLMLMRMQEQGWMQQDQTSRVIHITRKGGTAFNVTFPQMIAGTERFGTP